MYLKNISLKSHNTFGIDATAANFIAINRNSDFLNLLQSSDWQRDFFILAGGSNVLFTKNFEGSIIWVNNKGIRVIDENSEFVCVEVAAGEEWDDFVKWSVSNNYGGVENLALIPGKCGSSAVQNIGAYGSEAKDVIFEVKAFLIKEKKEIVLKNTDCQFDYRYSIFKNELKNKTIISSVVYKLSKNAKPQLNYQSLKDFLSNKNIVNPCIKDVYDAVCEIRNEKLPNHKEIGNAGSFFKNPIIDRTLFEKIFAKHPDLVFWEVSENRIKLAAGQLIEKCAWKGKRIGDAGVHAKQALVLVNYGNAKGIDIFNMSKNIIDDVAENFGIVLEPEVIIL